MNIAVTEFILLTFLELFLPLFISVGITFFLILAFRRFTHL